MSATSPRWPCSKSSAGWPSGKRSARKPTRWSPEDVLTGETGAELWSEALGRPVRYVGDDLDQWIQSLRAYAPNWMAYDFKYMMKHFQEDGPVSTAAGLGRLRQRLGRSPRSYRDFVLECATLWSAASS